VFQLVQSRRWKEGGGIHEFEKEHNGRWVGTRPWEASKQDLAAMDSSLNELSKELPQSTHGSTIKNTFRRAKGSKTHDYFVLASTIGNVMHTTFCITLIQCYPLLHIPGWCSCYQAALIAAMQVHSASTVHFYMFQASILASKQVQSRCIV
jgi:hypothetical protein